MATLDVEPKKNTKWWIWLLAGAILLALIFIFLNGRDDGTSNRASEGSKVVEPGWNVNRDIQLNKVVFIS